jgi:hypothetical protein
MLNITLRARAASRYGSGDAAPCGSGSETLFIIIHVTILTTALSQYPVPVIDNRYRYRCRNT